MKKNVALMALTGILTLASCSQGPDTTDKTAPTVTLTADKTSLPATGGTVTLTATVNETVSQVDFYRDGVKIGSDSTAPYTLPDTWAANTSTTATVAHTYTAKASDTAKNEGISNAIVVTQAKAETTTPGDTTTTSVLTIDLDGVARTTVTIKDANGANLPNYTNVSVNDMETVTLPRGTYTVVAGDVSGYKTPANTPVDLSKGNQTVKLSYTSNVTPVEKAVLTIDLVGVSSAPVTIRNASGTIVAGYNNVVVADNATVTLDRGVYTVTGGSVDGINAPSSAVRVDLSAGNGTAVLTYTATPTPANGITFAPAEEITTGKDLESGWRVLSQVVSTPGNPDPNTDVYVKGKDVTITFTRPGGVAGEIEVFLARTTGTDVPTNDQIQAADRIDYRANASTITVDFDSTTLGEFEGVRQWIVFRVNSTELYYRPVVSDNTAPQAAVPDFGRANNANSNIIASPLDPSIMAARGQIEVFTTNPDIQDKPFGTAPVGSSFAQRRPAGIESITYYVVPESRITAGVSDADLTRRAKAIKAVTGAQKTAAVMAATNTVNGNTTTDYRATLDSKALNLNGTYRIYAITRDKLGNEVASPSFDRVFFDNVGPSITGLQLCDVSALPFVSTDPCNIISDQALLTVGGVDDAGVGIDPETYGFNLGGVQLFANGVPTGLLGTITGSDGQYFLDTNRLPDGELAFNFSGLTDYLGNPVDPAELAAVNGKKILIDNTDPSLDINRPNGGQFTSGTEISINSKSTDVTSGVFQNLLFWDDTYFFENVDPIRNGGVPYIGNPVELGRVTADTPTQRRTEITNNQRMTAPFLSNFGRNPLPGTGLTTNQLQRQTFYAVAVATDRAGNATMQRVPMTIKPKAYDIVGASTLIAPRLGRSDGHNQSLVPNYQDEVDGTISPINDNTTILSFVTNRHNLSLLEAGTVSENATNTTNEALKSVNNYGTFAEYDWRVIRGYLLGTGTATTRVTDAIEAAYQERIVALRQAALLASRDRTLTAEERTQLISLGARASTLAAVTADGRFSDNADAPNPDDVTTVVNDADVNVFRPIRDATLANIAQFFRDPTLTRRAGLAQERDVQGWDDVNTPWLKLGDTATASKGVYTFTTNGLNNLYWNMQDTEASSYPTGGLFNNNGTNYSYVPSLFNAFQLDARYDSLAGVVMDTAGSYNYYGECYFKSAPNVNTSPECDASPR